MDTNLLTNVYYSQKQTYDIPIALVSFPISRLLTNIGWLQLLLLFWALNTSLSVVNRHGIPKRVCAIIVLVLSLPGIE